MSEILSPVGGPESLIAALRSGADAVYLGVGEFNARRNAVGFSENELCDAAKYCHTRGVKLYAALNTLVFDSELDTALDTAKRAALAGVDAFIVQDMGLASLLRRALPNTPLHASTQMSVHSPKSLEILKELGFCRVVAAREMSGKELEIFCERAAQLGLEVEVFVHGALCMSLSGQCYLSSTFGDRSGNRGLCAGPCRLPFSVPHGTGYDLSLKDLCLLSHIDELKKMGVASFKIEGRMKRPEYVAAATAAYRMAVDGKVIPHELTEMLRGVFSRNGFTDGYFTEKTGKAMFGRRDESDKELTAAVLNSLHALYRIERQSVSVSAKLTVKSGMPSVLSLSDGKHTVSAEGEIPVAAKTVPLSRDFAFGKISKLGNSCYKLENFEFQADEGLTLPSSALGKLRNDAAEKLSEIRSSVCPPAIETPTVENTESGLCKSAVAKSNLVFSKIFPFFDKKPPLLARFRTLGNIPSELDADGVILPAESDFENFSLNKPLFLELPRGMSGTESFIKSRIKNAKLCGARAAFCGNLASIELCREENFPFIADLGMNTANRLSAAAEGFLGAEGCLLSFELPAPQIRHLTENKSGFLPPLGVLVYGRPPLMLLKNCPNKNGLGCVSCGGISKITDRKNAEFTLICRNGFTEMFNPKPIFVADRLHEFGSPDFLTAYFTTESAEDAQKILKLINGGHSPSGEYTRGQYYRAVR